MTEPTLREALETIARINGPDLWAAQDIARAALAATPPALDVDRLAQAMVNADIGPGHKPTNSEYTTATDYAREYAALSTGDET